jgi:hypothetical protein
MALQILAVRLILAERPPDPFTSPRTRGEGVRATDARHRAMICAQ